VPNPERPDASVFGSLRTLMSNRLRMQSQRSLISTVMLTLGIFRADRRETMSRLVRNRSRTAKHLVRTARPDDEQSPRRTSRYGARAERRSTQLAYYWAMTIRTTTKFAMTVLAAATLAQSALSFADDTPTSYVPHPHTNNHVYGAPIQPAVVGRAKTSKRKPTPKKRSSSP
jgi:hypothetical protein